MNRGLLMGLVAAVVVLALGVVGIGAYVFVFMPRSQPAGAQEPAAQAEAAVLAENSVVLDKFVTNLADKDRVRYIDVTLALGLKSEADAETVEQIEPEIRDAILSQVRAMTAQDLAGAEGKDKLAAAVQQGLSPLLEGKLVKVFVTNMVIQ